MNFSIRLVSYVVLVILIFLTVIASGTTPRRGVNPHWHSASATWYGSPNGDGSDGTFRVS